MRIILYKYMFNTPKFDQWGGLRIVCICYDRNGRSVRMMKDINAYRYVWFEVFGYTIN